MDQIKIKSDNNFKRDIKALAHKINVPWDSKNSRFAFYRKEEIDCESIQGEWIEQSGIIMICGSILTDNAEKKTCSHSIPGASLNEVSGYTKAKLIQLCPLLADFERKEEFKNNKMFFAGYKLTLY